MRNELTTSHHSHGATQHGAAVRRELQLAPRANAMEPNVPPPALAPGPPHQPAMGRRIGIDGPRPGSGNAGVISEVPGSGTYSDGVHAQGRRPAIEFFKNFVTSCTSLLGHRRRHAAAREDT